MTSVQKDSPSVLIALGGNQPSAAGPVSETLRMALRMLDAQGLRLLALSRFFSTPAHPAGSGPDYVNAAARLATDLPPQAVLAALHAVEAHFGRERGVRWGARGLDLDLLAAGARILPDAATEAAWRGLAPAEQMRRTPQTLILPHPRLHQRAFVLIPLADIAPRWRHPALGKTVVELLAALPEAEKAAIRPFEGF